MVVELVPIATDSILPANSLPFDTKNTRSKRQRVQHICDICLQIFRTVSDFDAHRRQGCESLIEIDSNEVDFKPTPVDFINAKCDKEFDENHGTNDDSAKINEATKISEKVAECPKKKDDVNRSLKKKGTNKIIENSKDQKNIVKINRKRSDVGIWPCPFCDKM